ncbi:4'-phosphopantetheine phosphatase [Aplysia californica]|uniref:4'-phosphopantetheine phosphatase n=1 Tax=Aplysia californica TaxID=6500 RepID=A0ABM1A466_APLCA|nr:4'-phosphopantetheine phosphatase [Aplysia californica]XP_012940483.1 4'-phosphopantetheine phosphatase [Aplysia californica]XP_035826799.1 4'-phosphopantetheine phosphatase [Aplysia californica]
MAHKSYAKSIDLPTEKAFHNICNAKRFAIDIGGSLAKVAYSSLVKKKSTMVFDEPESYGSNKGAIYNVSETDQECVRLHFVKFETKYIETCLDFIQANLIQSKECMVNKVIKVTGGGAYKYTDLVSGKLGVQVDKEDEIECLIEGCNFLLKNIPDEAFSYMRHGNPEYRFQGVDSDIFPYLLVNIGSGVSLCKVESESKFERIGGTSMGGGTFWGMGSLLTSAREFDELLELAEQGDHKSVDMLVKDIYGGNYGAIGLGADVIASSFGKAARSPRDTSVQQFKKEDVARSLLLCISNDIGQIAYLQAKLHGVKKIYFGGFFIRGHPFTMHTMTFAINFWSKGEIQALFLRHEGYLCAIGAFLKGMEEEDAERYSWGENLAGSSGLQSPKHTSASYMQKMSMDFAMLEINRLDRPLLPCPLLLDVSSYLPDTVDLMQDGDAREYWLSCFADSAHKTRDLAAKSQLHEPDAEERANLFLEKYLDRLQSLKQNPGAFGSLTVRNLLDTSTHFLEESQFTDTFSQQKQIENEQALQQLASRLKYLDGLEPAQRHLELAMGVLAGNVFDWGAKEIREILEVQEFGLQDAQAKLQKRPWLFDDFDAWLDRLTNRQPYRCAVIFCDNSGVDIILGILPFARQLLLMGTNVILCANSHPSLNDVVYTEMLLIAKKVSEVCPVLRQALEQERFRIMESGQASPCLDLRLIDEALVVAIKELEADLIVIEGMGRAVHTNFHAAFACDSLKAAVIKNKWLANRFGGEMFSVMFKYERARCISSSSSSSASLTSSPGKR